MSAILAGLAAKEGLSAGIKAAGSLFGGKGGDTASNVGGALGAGQLVSSMIKKRQANQMKPNAVDPLQSKLYQEASQKRRQYESGYDPMSQAARRTLNTQLAGSQANVMKRAGGNVGAAMAGNAMAQSAAGNAANKALAATSERVGYYDQMRNQMGDAIAKRKLDLGLMGYAQKMREAGEQGKAGWQGVMGAMARDTSGARRRLGSVFSGDNPLNNTPPQDSTPPSPPSDVFTMTPIRPSTSPPTTLSPQAPPSQTPFTMTPIRPSTSPPTTLYPQATGGVVNPVIARPNINNNFPMNTGWMPEPQY